VAFQRGLCRLRPVRERPWNRARIQFRRILGK
jgi:hypothetical protein